MKNKNIFKLYFSIYLLFLGGLLFSQTDSDSIDIELLTIDIEDVKSGYYDSLNLPITIGAFPVEPYPGSGGAFDLNINVCGNKLAGASFMIGKSNESLQHFKFNSTHRVYCNIIILTDSLDNFGDPYMSNMVYSRNHPNYLGLGTVITKNYKIDYVTFVEIEQNRLNSYAIINGKLYNLENGNTIIVVPQKDYSLKFKQLNIMEENFMEINGLISNELNKKELVNFICNDNSIAKK